MKNNLQDITQYSPQLSISQVMTLFDRKGIKITRSMIQNYVRDGLLPPPINKRYYSHKHLAALILIDELKTVYEMSSIKTVMSPLMDEEGLPLEQYQKLVSQTEELQKHTSIDPLLRMIYSVDIKKEVLNDLS